MDIRSTVACIALVVAACTAPEEQPANGRAATEESAPQAQASANASVAADDTDVEDQPAVANSDAPAADKQEAVGACLKQGDRQIPANALKGLGTEPFWAVRIEGRCVTYMTPEDQDGTRIWTQFSGDRDNGIWSGYLDRQSFVLRTRPEAGCSDGMSDNRYPLAVTLTVRGEQRTGCAQPQ